MAVLPSRKPRHTARGIVVHNNQILLMERWRNGLHYFSIPGGGIEANESAPDALEREILEETSLIVECENLALEMHDGRIRHYIFQCRYISGEPHLSAHAPERQAGPNNRFKPCWQPVSALNGLPLIYWEALRKPLVEGLAHGFPAQPVIVTATTPR